MEYSVPISLTNCVLELKEQEPIIKNSRCVIEYAIWGCLLHNLTCLWTSSSWWWLKFFSKLGKIIDEYVVPRNFSVEKLKPLSYYPVSGNLYLATIYSEYQYCSVPMQRQQCSLPVYSCDSRSPFLHCLMGSDCCVVHLKHYTCWKMHSCNNMASDDKLYGIIRKFKYLFAYRYEINFHMPVSSKGNQSSQGCWWISWICSYLNSLSCCSCCELTTVDFFISNECLWVMCFGMQSWNFLGRVNCADLPSNVPVGDVKSL